MLLDLRILWTIGLSILLAVLAVSSDDGNYTDQFVVEVKGGEQVAQQVATTRGFKLERKVRNLPNMYVFSHPEVGSRSKRYATDMEETLRGDPNVLYVEQQRLLKREKRQPIADGGQTIHEIEKRGSFVSRDDDDDSLRIRAERPRSKMTFNDPHYKHQWYLENIGQNGGHVGNDLNVVPAWQQGFSGEGVVVCVLDDGLQHEHADLKQNYMPETSADFNDNPGVQGDPSPDTSVPDNNHGTECAGEVSAEANNGICGVGIAFNSKISGIRILDGDVTDSLEAEALTFMMQDIDIYSASWGPPDDGTHMDGPRRTCSDALRLGATEGRGGLGSIYVWATGNGASRNDTCSCDGYVGNIHTISIGSVTEEGLSSYFTETCPSTLAVSYTGGSHSTNTPDTHQYAVVTTNVDNKCNTRFQGTSAAAPLAAGCFALVLQANPQLTWRDLQYLIVNTARIPSSEEEGWHINGAGKHINDHMGFGVLDCSSMVELAQNWITVPEQRNCSTTTEKSDMVIGPATGGRQEPTCVNFTLTLEPCMDGQDQIRQLEHTTLNIDMTVGRRGDVAMDLYSPMGTMSHILEYRTKDDGIDLDFEFGGFMTVANWGEEPFGDWILTVCNGGNSTSITVNRVKLTVFGVSTTTEPGSEDKRKEGRGRTFPHPASKKEVEDFMATEKARSTRTSIRAAPGLRTENGNNDQRSQAEEWDRATVELIEKSLA